MSPTAQILAVAAITAGSCSATAAAMAAVHYWRKRRPAKAAAEPIVPAAPDNQRGTDAEAFGTCHAIYHTGTAKRRNTKGIR